MIQQLLYKYLVLNGQLGLPDIGSFTIHRQSAVVDAAGTALLAPIQEIRFEPKAVQADKNLFLFLAHETDSDEVTAIGQFNEWVKSTKEKLTQTSVAEMPFMGSLRVTGEGDYHFDALSAAIGQSAVELPEGLVWKTITTEDESVVETADSSWWIYAIILLLLGIAAIAYRYL
jgi:hypothetical protein